jgi:hypothetical protein
MTTYFERHHLRQTGAHDFALDCPYCAGGTLHVCVAPELLGTEQEFDLWGIRADGRCAPGCACPLTDAEIGRIEAECARRAGVALRGAPAPLKK